MSKAICIAVVLLGVCAALTLRLTNGYQTADLAAAVPTDFAKARPPSERDEPIVIKHPCKGRFSDRLVTLPSHNACSRDEQHSLLHLLTGQQHDKNK